MEQENISLNLIEFYQWHTKWHVYGTRTTNTMRVYNARFSSSKWKKNTQRCALFDQASFFKRQGYICLTLRMVKVMSAEVDDIYVRKYRVDLSPRITVDEIIILIDLSIGFEIVVDFFFIFLMSLN